MCGGGRNKRARSTSGDSASGGPTKSPQRNVKDRARAGAVSALDLDEVPIPCRDVVDTDDHSAIGVGVLWYAGVGYRGSTANSSGRFAVMLLSHLFSYR